MACPGCGDVLISQIENELCERGIIEKCVCCPGREFFVRKDFPQKIGLSLVIIVGLIASFFFYQRNIVATFAALGSLVIVDAVIFLVVGKVLVCYRCRAEYRGVQLGSDVAGFDLATSEKYD